MNDMTCMGMQVADCAEIALKVFREDPMAERSTILRHLVAHHGSPSQFELEKVKGAKKVKLLKIKARPFQPMPLLSYYANMMVGGITRVSCKLLSAVKEKGVAP